MELPTPEEAAALREKLPKRLERALFSADTADVIRAIQVRENFSLERCAILADEVGFVLLKYTTPDDFSSRLRERLKLSDITTAAIAREVQQTIFDPLLPELTGAPAKGRPLPDWEPEQQSGYIPTDNRLLTKLLRDSTKEEGFLIDQLCITINNKN